MKDPRTWLAVMALSSTIIAVAAGSAWAQHGGHGAHGPGHSHQQIDAWNKEFEAVVREGRGFGMAFAADQNGYPGPMHALELKSHLQLTPEQEVKLHALMAAMFSEARPKGAWLVERETRLRQLFAGRTADAATVLAAVAEVEAARRDVRLVHLLTHLKTREILTDAQIEIYTALRWGR
jgi:Spy/CpxP family protein refolding chaperone